MSPLLVLSFRFSLEFYVIIDNLCSKFVIILYTFVSLGASYNLPRPNGFIFASKSKKSSPNVEEEVEIRPSKMWNMVKPNGFFFPSVPASQGKRSMEDYEEEEEASDFYSMLSNMFGTPDMESEMVKRDNFDESTFFAGRGKRGDAEIDADSFFAGRGKKDNVNHDLAAFFAGRGKKGGNVGDIFFAGRG